MVLMECKGVLRLRAELGAVLGVPSHVLLYQEQEESISAVIMVRSPLLVVVVSKAVGSGAGWDCCSSTCA